MANDKSIPRTHMSARSTHNIGVKRGYLIKRSYPDKITLYLLRLAEIQRASFSMAYYLKHRLLPGSLCQCKCCIHTIKNSLLKYVPGNFYISTMVVGVSGQCRYHFQPRSPPHLEDTQISSPRKTQQHLDAGQADDGILDQWLMASCCNLQPNE